MDALEQELSDLETLLSEDEESNEPKKSKAEDINQPKSKAEQIKSMLSKANLEPGELEIVNFLETRGGDVAKALKFDDLDSALLEQASLYAFYGECTAHAQMQAAQAKQNVENIEARLSLSIREKLISDGEKITEKVIESKIKIQSSYKNALSCLNEAQFVYKSTQTILEAFIQREQMIIQTCKRKELEQFAKTSIKGRDERIKAALDKSR